MAQGPEHIPFESLAAGSFSAGAPRVGGTPDYPDYQGDLPSHPQNGHYFDSFQGDLTAGAPAGDIGLLFEDPLQTAHEEGQRLYDAGLIYRFKKTYDKAIQFLENAHHLALEGKQFPLAIKALIELAWIKYCHDKKDGRTKASRLMATATKLINTYIDTPGINDCRARLLHYQGLVKYREKQFGEAVKDLMYAKTFCHPDSLECAKIHDSLAVHYERTNDYNRSIQCVLYALNIKQREGISYEEAISNQILGRIYILKEELELAEQCLKNALDISEDLNDYRRIAKLKNELIKLKIYQGDIPSARQLIENNLSECHLNDLRVDFAMALFYQAYIYYAEDNLGECQRLLDRDILPIFKRFEDLKGYAMAIRLMACVENQAGQETLAIELMSESISIFRQGNQLDELAKTYFELGKLYLSINEKKLALASMLEALQIAEVHGLTFLISYIEDEIFKLDEDKWQEIVEKRARNERVFERSATLEESLTSLSHAEGEQDKDTPTTSLVSLLKIAQAMAAERDLERLLQLIKTETENALNADRCTVFLYNRDTNELWSRVASGMETQEIRFPAHLGLAGYVAKTGEILNIKNAYEDPRFNQEIDRKTGYKTETILCMPMRNRKMEIMGVFQVLNKRGGHFEAVDENLLNAITTNAGIAIENASLATEMRVSFESFVKTLSSTIDSRDPITAGHSERVAAYSSLIGEEMNMSGPDLEALKYASLLHDIGKIGIKEDILKKDGRLTEKEYRHIQKHVFYTHEILKNIHFERHLRQVPEIAASHHEKVDGTGYHRGLQGSEIMLSGRILALSDVFDAITSRRHYRNRMPFDRVLSIIQKDAGSHFDKDCVDSFFHIKLCELAHILLMERADDYDEDGLILLRKLDRHITISDYQFIMKKNDLSRGEADVHRVFNSLYHRTGIGDMD